MRDMRSNQRVLLFSTVLSAIIACSGSPEGEENEGEITTAGGEGEDTTADAVETDPCAPSEGVPCEDEGTREVGGPDAGVADAGVANDAAVSDAGEPADPEEAWRQRVARGRVAFNRTCDTCHPGGEEDIGPNIRRIGWATERMVRQIRRGGGRMRPIPPRRLPDERIDDLMAFLSTMGTVRGVERPGQ